MVTYCHRKMTVYKFHSFCAWLQSKYLKESSRKKNKSNYCKWMRPVLKTFRSFIDGKRLPYTPKMPTRPCYVQLASQNPNLDPQFLHNFSMQYVSLRVTISTMDKHAKYWPGPAYCSTDNMCRLYCMWQHGIYTYSRIP